VLLTRGPDRYLTVVVLVKGDVVELVIVLCEVVVRVSVIVLVNVIDVPTSTTKVQAPVVVSASSKAWMGALQ
jgi:hypothetical protein